MAFLSASTFLLLLIFPFRCCEGAADGRCEVGFGNLSVQSNDVLELGFQYIVADMSFTCNGNITEWNIAASVPWRRRPHSIALQLWRPQGSDGEAYSLVTSQVFSTSFSTRTSSTMLTFSPFPEMPFSSGDVVGFHVPSASKSNAPLSVLFDSPATDFTMYKESGPRTTPDTTADVSSSFSTLTTVSPLLSVVVRTATFGNTTLLNPQFLRDASSQPTNTTNSSSIRNSNSAVTGGQAAGITIGVLVFVGLVIAAIHIAVGAVLVQRRKYKGRLFALSQAVRDMRTSLLYRGGENPSPLVDNEDERGLSVTYENDVMGRRGQVPGTYYNMPEPKIAGIAPPRSGQSSNSSTLYRFVQNMASRGSGDSDADSGSVYEELEAVYEEVTIPALEDQKFVQPPLQLEGLFGYLATRKCIEIPVDALRLTSTLGAGQFGNVQRGFIESQHGEKAVAVKRLKERASQTEKVTFLQEAVVMKQFLHPNILRLVGVVTKSEPCMLVLEYAHRGDLRGYLIDMRPDPGELPDPCLRGQQLRFCREIANGMQYLSKKGFIHRDLAARNVLLDSKLKCKIADFGLSKNLDSECYVSDGGLVPIKWTAPEGIFHKMYTTKSDVWSYGMVMYEIWSLGDKPFPHLTAQEVVRKLQTDPQYVQPPPNGCPDDIYKLMVLCWNYNYTRRPGFDAVLSALYCLDEEEVAILDDGN